MEPHVAGSLKLVSGDSVWPILVASFWGCLGERSSLLFVPPYCGGEPLSPSIEQAGCLCSHVSHLHTQSHLGKEQEAGAFSMSSST